MGPGIRNRKTKKKHTTTVQSIVPGRAPVGSLPGSSDEMFPLNAYDQMVKGQQDDSSRNSLAAAWPSSDPVDNHSSSPPVVKLQGPSSWTTAIPEGLSVGSANSIKIVPVKAVKVDVGRSSTYTPISQQKPVEDSIREQPSVPVIPYPTPIGIPSGLGALGSSERYSTISADIATSLSNFRYHEIHSSRSHERCAELNAPYTTQRNFNCELQDINTLPSSQPISLGSLVSTTPAKNKGSKGSKSPKAESNEESADNMDTRYGNYRGTRQIPRMPAVANAASTAHPLRNMTRVGAEDIYGDVAQPQYYFTPQDSQDMGQHAYSDDRGPVSYPHREFGQSMPHQMSNMTYTTFAAGPPLARPRLMGPEDISPTKQEEKFALQESQYNMAAGNNHHEGVYRSNMTNRNTGQANNPLRVRIPPGFENIQGNTDTHNNIGFSAVARMQHGVEEQHDFGLTNFGTSNTTSQFAQMSSNMAGTIPAHYRSPHHNNGAQNYPTSISTGSPVAAGSSTPAGGMVRSRADWGGNRNESLGIGQSTEKRISENNPGKSRMAKPHPVTADLSDPFLMSIDRLADYDRTPAQGFNGPAWDVANLREASIDPSSWPSMGLNTQNGAQAHASDGQSLFSTTQPGYPFGRYIGGQFSSGPDMVYRPVPWPVTPAKDASKSTESTKFPPPGLSHPSTPPEDLNNPNDDGSDTPADDNDVPIPDTLTWFHSDRRGEEDLRKRIEDISLKDKESRAQSKAPVTQGVNPETVEATTVLLGHAIANLQSYLVGDRKSQAGNFANFGPVPDECCEPTRDGNRSYFDSNPLTDPWKLPSPRPTRKDPEEPRK